MKSFFLSLFVSVFLSISSFAGGIKILWDLPPESELIQQFNVYEVKSGVLELVGTTQMNNFVIPVITPAAHTYVVKSVNMWGESEASDPVSTAAQPTKPTGLRITPFN